MIEFSNGTEVYASNESAVKIYNNINLIENEFKIFNHFKNSLVEYLCIPDSKRQITKDGRHFLIFPLFGRGFKMNF